jgi:hypothetical protein
MACSRGLCSNSSNKIKRLSVELLHWWINIIATDLPGIDMDVMKNEEGIEKVGSEHKNVSERGMGTMKIVKPKKNYRNGEQ